jgi:hypothetical protein
MGWIDKLTSYVESFQTKVELERTPSRINLTNIDNWLKNTKNNLFLSLQDDFSNYLNKIKDLKWNYDNYFEIFNKQILYNPKGKEEIRDILFSTKKLLNYILKHSQISHYVEKSEQINQCPITIKNKLEDRSLNINLKNFNIDGFDHDFLPIILNKIIDLNKNFKNKLLESGILKYDLIEQSAFRVINSSKKIKLLNNVLLEKRARFASSAIKSNENEDELKKIKLDPSYVNLIKEKHELKKQKKQKNKLILEISNYFEHINPALEKYVSISQNPQLISNYIQNALETFKNDEGLTIIHELSHINMIITSGKLDLPLTILNNIIPLIEKGESNYLKDLHKNISDIVPIAPPTDAFVDDQVLNRIDEIEYRLEHYTQLNDKLQQEIEQSTFQLNQEIEKQKFEKSIFENLIKVNIKREIILNF